MSDLIGPLTESLTGEDPPPTMDMSARTLTRMIVSAYGSNRAAGRGLGIAESTIRGWLGGAQPKRGKAFLVSAARRALSAADYPAAYNGSTELHITGVIATSDDVRHRTIHPGRYIPKSIIQDVLALWADGDNDRKANDLLTRAIDRYYNPFRYDQIERVWFE